MLLPPLIWYRGAIPPLCAAPRLFVSIYFYRIAAAIATSGICREASKQRSQLSDFCRKSLGLTPVIFLKIREKYTGSAMPTRSATS